MKYSKALDLLLAAAVYASQRKPKSAGLCIARAIKTADFASTVKKLEAMNHEAAENARVEAKVASHIARELAESGGEGNPDKRKEVDTDWETEHKKKPDTEGQTSLPHPDEEDVHMEHAEGESDDAESSEDDEASEEAYADADGSSDEEETKEELEAKARAVKAKARVRANAKILSAVAKRLNKKAA